jgi:predicted DNA-binding transcriptional regulator
MELHMITLSPDEVALIRSLLTALRGIKVRDIDKALVILSKSDRARDSGRGDRGEKSEG